MPTDEEVEAELDRWMHAYWVRLGRPMACEAIVLRYPSEEESEGESIKTVNNEAVLSTDTHGTGMPE